MSVSFFEECSSEIFLVYLTEFWKYIPNIDNCTYLENAKKKKRLSEFGTTTLNYVKSSPATRHGGAWGERRYSS
jgi:hypothetical protein